MEQKKVFNVKEICKYLKVSESCIRKAVKENKIPYFKILSKVLFDKETIDSYIKENSMKNLESEQNQNKIRFMK